MRSYTQNSQQRKPVSNQGNIAPFPRHYNSLALSAIIFTLFISILTLSGCVGLTSAGSLNKPGSTSAGVLAPNTTSVDFGSVPLGSKSSQMLTLTNSGTLPVTISQATVFGSGFSVSGAIAAISIAPGTSQAIQVEFAPAVAGSSNGSLVVASNATDPSLRLALTGNAMVKPSIKTQPASQSVLVGQTATFDVVATGSGALSYQWKKNGVDISGANSSSYTTPPATLAESGETFSVTLSDAAGTFNSNSATLTVTSVAVAPSITAEPASKTVVSGQTATFGVTATGTATLLYQWKKNGVAISGATSESYTTPVTSAADSGESFTVTVSNSKGSVNSTAASLTVTAPAALPSITTEPSSHSVKTGQTATFTVGATGAASLTYQWKKNGAAISGASAPSYTTPPATTSDNGAAFTVAVSDSAGTVTSSAAMLTVLAAPVSAVAPSITSQPSSQTVTAGKTATFTVAATGTAPLTYQWAKNGSAISGATSASYTTPATTTSDNGASFTATVTDAAGSATSNSATLNVTTAAVAPSITAQPVSRSVSAGQTATFTVTATGTATLAYQWKKNGSAISGATSASYTTPATSTSDSGASFTVTVSNASGSVTSGAATLSVTAVTAILNESKSTLSFSGVNIGSSSTSTVVLTNTGNSDVTVSSVTISGAGFAASGVSTGQILTPGQTATLSVTFTPSGTASVTGNVTVASNATNSPATVALAGTGVQAVVHSATLAWTASTSTVTGYNIYRSAVSGGSYTKLNSQLISGTQYADSAVVSGQTYFYVVTSEDSSGVESAFSNQASTIIP